MIFLTGFMFENLIRIYLKPSSVSCIISDIAYSGNLFNMPRGRSPTGQASQYQLNVEFKIFPSNFTEIYCIFQLVYIYSPGPLASFASFTQWSRFFKNWSSSSCFELPKLIFLPEWAKRLKYQLFNTAHCLPFYLAS